MWLDKADLSERGARTAMSVCARRVAASASRRRRGGTAAPVVLRRRLPASGHWWPVGQTAGRTDQARRACSPSLTSSRESGGSSLSSLFLQVASPPSVPAGLSLYCRASGSSSSHRCPRSRKRWAVGGEPAGDKPMR
ncbi:unnamed protein product [Protopolystoma xenopodis]|uniref:Uncharacterized protein n=1 Tax=Protopolystoma xenopodis TaxID=117903 RepID=A0A448WYF0_9PLAT|nr:unnamed protein product [Protopolystoma xenopodis]